MEKKYCCNIKKNTSKHLRPLPILFFLRVLSFWEKSVMILNVPGPSICYTWGPAWSNLNCPCPTMGRRDQEGTQEVLVLETLWQLWVSSTIRVLRDFRSLRVGNFSKGPFSFINIKVWFYNFESKEWQHSQLWEFDQQAEGKKEEERSTGEQKTQEGHVSPSSAFLGNFGDNCDNTTSDEWLKMKRIDPY